MSVDELEQAMMPGDLGAAEKVARAYIVELGDLPEAVWYRLGFIQSGADRDRLWDRLKEIRAEHFRELGKPMPPYQTEWY